MNVKSDLNVSKQDLARKLFQLSYLTGHFKLRSGQTSQEYFDKYRFESQPEVLRSIAQFMAPLIPSHTQILAGLEMGGIPIATALALETGLPMTFVRKQAKNYGTCQVAEGSEVKDRKICIIEDVVTTGGQILLSTQDLRKMGASVHDVLCVIYRGKDSPHELQNNNLNLKSLFTMEELKKSAK